MYAEERKQQIASLTAVEGRVSVAELATRFGVTSETIRRDLAALHTDGVLRRVHGGAVSSHPAAIATTPPDDGSDSPAPGRNKFAKAAVDALPEGTDGVVFIDSGACTEDLARLISGLDASRRFQVVTNAIPLALELDASGYDAVQLLGGNVHASTQTVVGGTALRTLALMRADAALIWANAFTIEQGLTSQDASEAAVKAAMVTNAAKVIVVCESSSIGMSYRVSFAPLDTLDVVITDEGAPPGFVDELRANGVEVVLVPRP